MASREFLDDFLEDQGSDISRSVSGRESVASSCFETELDIEEYNRDMFGDSESCDDAGRVVYLRACQSLGVVPVRRFLDELNGKEIRVTQRNLGPYGSKAIATALVVNNSITSLDLSNNMMGDQGANYIASAIIEKDLVKVLVLAGNHFTSPSAEVFGEFLQRSKNLTVLNLSGNKFDDKDCVVLAESLKHNNVLRELDLSHNMLTQKAGVALGEVLTINTSLQRLSLAWNLICGNGAVAMAKGITANQNLEMLDLSWNGIDDVGGCAIASGLETNNHLVEIQLACNRISDKGLLEIVKVLEKCHVQIIDVSRNSFLGSNKAVETLLGFLIQGQTWLKRVDVGQIPLNKESVVLLEELKKVRPDVEFHHGYKRENAYQETPPKNINPCDILRNYATTRGLPAFRFFRSLGETDEFRESIPSGELENGLRKLNLFNDYQVQEVINILDRDKNGTVDYSEFMVILAGE